jgi:hypothetical protein
MIHRAHIIRAYIAVVVTITLILQVLDSQGVI